MSEHLRRMWVITLALAAATVVESRASALDQQPLPSFPLVSSDGMAVSSTQLSQHEQWLLVYVMPGCVPCDRLLAAFKTWQTQTPSLVERVVLIVGGETAAAQAYLDAQMPRELSGLAWFADPAGEAFQTLRLQGAPVLIGVRQGRVEWEISGVLSDPNALASVVVTWVGR